MACGILVPRPGIEPVPPAMEGRFLTARPPEKSLSSSFYYTPHKCLSIPTERNEKKEKKSLLGCCTGESPYLDRAVSSPVGRMSLNVCRVETDLFFLDSLSSYQFDGQRLALLTFYLTTFAPSWPVLKCLLAMAFFFFLQKTEAMGGRELQPLCPPLPSTAHPWGAPVTLGPCRTLSERL